MDKIKAKKSLGQNFLIDKTVIKKIVDSNQVLSNDLIIEIGPGKGALTSMLKAFNTNIICYEIDERMKSILNELEDEKTKVIYNDFLKANIKNDISNYKYNKLYIFGNLPYYITTPIIKRIIESNLDVEAITIMVQNEVADRFTAKEKTKEYGSMTVYLKYYFDVEKLFVVKNVAFDPAPKVDSAVIKLTKKNKKLKVNSEEKFFKLIEDSFKYKRKTLKNNLKDYNWTLIYNFLKSKGYLETVRAEEISIENFALISNLL